jgi:predicted esterase
MPEFTPAKILKQHYQVFGHFYQVELRGGEQVACRSVVEIVRREEIPALPDAIFIMMNPGSSEPLEPVQQLVKLRNLARMKVSLVATKSDPTQYQLMRLMQQMGWRYVRVLNLSDLINTRGAGFARQYNALESQTGFDSHSIFAEERKPELTQQLKRQRGAPIVLAWGLNVALDPLIHQCLNSIGHLEGITGLLVEGSKKKYRHPLPALQVQKQQWVTDMVARLGGAAQSDKPKVIFAHGKESGPWGSKIRVLAELAKSKGCEVDSIDYTDLVDEPDGRVARLVGLLKEEEGPVILVGSSMGGYVSLVASENHKVAGVFLLAPALQMPGYERQAYQSKAKRIEIVHGWGDDICDPQHSIDYAKTAGCELHLIEGDHRLNSSLDEVLVLFAGFLDHLFEVLEEA